MIITVIHHIPSSDIEADGNALVLELVVNV